MRIRVRKVLPFMYLHIAKILEEGYYPIRKTVPTPWRSVPYPKLEIHDVTPNPQIYTGVGFRILVARIRREQLTHRTLYDAISHLQPKVNLSIHIGLMPQDATEPQLPM